MENAVHADIVMQGVSKSYSSRIALNGFSMDIPAGGKFALLGPNGAGKSTTLKLLVGLLLPDIGTVRIGGFEPTSLEAKRITGYLPEDASPYNTLSVRENMEYIAALRGVEDPADRVDELLDVLDLREYERYKVSRLSRGTRQKLAIALSIIHRPSVVLLDEPLNYLDIPTQESVVKLFEGLHSTMLVSTHILSIARRLTTDAVLISRGRKIWAGQMKRLEESASDHETVESVIVRLIENDRKAD
ncbi:MAG: ABC transporter ATP-binding protein [Methanomassiliicoccales archaeon]